jgi:hypothetical protein
MMVRYDSVDKTGYSDNTLDLMYKLSHLIDGRWVEHSSSAVYSIDAIGAVPCLKAGVPSGDPAVFEQLVLVMEAPYFVLYVLHTPRGEGEAGRYQSPELSALELRAFIERFSAYLSSDARFDIWAHSPAERATVVWDRHNELFAYGPLERFAAKLRGLGFEEGPLEGSIPHQHHYRVEFDQDAAALLNHWSWSYSPLRPEDEQ